MLRSPGQRLERVLRGLVLALSVVFVLLFLLIAWRRMRYPFEVDRLESGMLTSVWRLRHGYPLYSAPSLEWAPFLYAPLFFYVAAAVTKLTGITFGALRLVSTLATVGSFAAIFALVWTETRRFAAAVFAVGLFASLYPFVLAWYDVGRVDSLATFLFLLALLATRRTHPLFAALLWLLVFLAKQTFLPLGLAMFLIDWQRPRRMLTGMVTYAALTGSSIALLNHLTRGWFSYYAFGTVAGIGSAPRLAVMFPFTDLLAPSPIAAALILAAALFAGLRLRDRDDSYLIIVTVLLTGAMGYVRAHVGANINAVIPVYAWIAVLSGVAIHRLILRLPRLLPPGPEAANAATLVASAVWLLAGVQLAAHLYRPAEIGTGNLGARQQFIAALRATPGDVWVVDHSYDSILAGKPLHADMDALDAVLGRPNNPVLAQFAEASRAGHFSAVVLDRDPAGYAPKGLFTGPPFSNVYRLQAKAPGGDAPGDRDQPELVLLPCTQTAAPPGSLLDLHTEFADRSLCPTP